MPGPPTYNSLYDWSKMSAKDNGKFKKCERLTMVGEIMKSKTKENIPSPVHYE